MGVKLPVRFLGQHDEVDEILGAIEQGTSFRRRKVDNLFEVDNLIHQGNELLLSETFRESFGEILKVHSCAFCNMESDRGPPQCRELPVRM